MLEFDIILSSITPWLFGLSLLAILAGAIIDIVKKRFYWTKRALILFLIAIILLVIEAIISANIANSF
jgi:hypothetical protein